MRRLILALLLLPGVALAQGHTRQACVDGTDCYCDCVEDTPGTGANPPGDVYASDHCETENIPIDNELIWCEDFENPSFEDPDKDTSAWKDVYGSGGTPCCIAGATNSCQNTTMEGGTGFGNACRNIFQSPDVECRKTTSVPAGLRPDNVGGFGDYEYDAASTDLNEGGNVPGLNGIWDGCQTWGFLIGVGRDGGGAADFNPAAYQNIRTLSHTMIVKYSSNHFIGAASAIFSNNIKGDRYSVGNQNAEFNTPMGGAHTGATPGDPCSRASADPATGFPLSGKFPFSSLWKTRKAGSDGIKGQGLCCDDHCYADAATMIGGEYHRPCSGTGCVVRRLNPPQSLWNPRVPGGVPMSVEGDQDGRDEWLCMQWTMEDHGTNQANYTFSINNQVIMHYENLQMSADNSPMVENISWLNQSTIPGDNPEHKNNPGPYDWYQARDNFHLTLSSTPISCAQVGFDGLPTVDPTPPTTQAEGATMDGLSFP